MIYQAGLLEPGWEIRVDEQWVVVEMMVLSERAGGARRVWLYSGSEAVLVVSPETLVEAKPPPEDETPARS